ncbi:MAG: hypothetical protein Q9Q40_00255 [Acidobacteriota bacterium]|nr:hypothetical protein [Acidobacteriota bacterium]
MIPPGGSGRIVTRIRTAGIQGRRTKTVEVETNDPRHRRLRLSVSFLAQAPVEVYPQPSINLYGTAGAEIEMNLLFHRPDGQPLELQEITPSRTGLVVEAEKVTEVGGDPPGQRARAVVGDWRVKIRLADSSEARSEVGTLRVVTNHPERPEMSLPIRIRVTPAIQAQPARLNIRVQAGDPPLLRGITLRNTRRKPFRATSIDVTGNLAGLSASVTTDRPRPVQRLEIRIDTSALRPGIYAGRLVVHTNQATLPRILVPVRIEVVAARDGRPPASTGKN